MADIFQLGEQGSASKLRSQLETIRAQGESVLAQIETARLETLVEFERRLTAMNGRRQRANRVQAPRVAAKFVASDFLDIDQAQTTATVRADVQAVTLRERETPALASIRFQRFSTSIGTAEAMDTNSSLYRVRTDDGSTPTGTFEIELVEPLTLTLLVFDLAAMPSEPTISVEVSSNGTTYVPAKQISQSGYRLNAWVDPMLVRFVRVIITPSHPDTLGGSSYTFGLTAFSGSTIEFHLASEFVSRPIAFRPGTSKVRLNAPADSGLTYFLAFNGGPFIEVHAGAEVDVPGVADQNILSVAMDDNTGLLAHPFPADAYVETLWVEQEGSSDVIRVAPGLLPNSDRDDKLVHKYIGVNDDKLYFIRDDISVDIGKTFTLWYTTGPSAVTVQLKVQLTTSNRAITPVFNGAVLEEI